MKKFAILAMTLGLGIVAQAQPFYLRGSINNWDTSAEFLLQSGTTYEAAVTGLNPGDDHQFKMGNADWTIVQPSGFQNLRARVNASGEIRCRLYDVETPNDGWLPNSRRVGIVNVGTTYELIGELTGWGFGIPMTMNGSVESAVADLDGGRNNEFKFRGTGGDWSYNVGNDLGEANNIAIAPASAGAHSFELDILNGKYRIVEASANKAAGVINLGNYAGQVPNSDKVRISMQVMDSANNVVQTTAYIVDAATQNFNYSVVLHPSITGTAKIRFDGPTWISRVVAFDVINGTASVNVTLPNGDSNNDTIVDIGDYTILAAAFDANFGEGNYVEGADLNKDAIVDIADYTILAGSFDASDE
ncbi:MAG: hypothetical protein JNJ45_04840 [Chthonomonas sp.]|nr:hypothetical protein [Chthonomonas sp.]